MKLTDSVFISGFIVLVVTVWLALSLCPRFAWTPLSFAASDSVVIATVNNASIMKPEVDRLILEYKRKTGKREIPYEEKKKLLKNLIRRHLILHQESVQALKHYKDIIEKVKKYEEDLIVARFLQYEVGSQVKVTEDEIKRYYKENRHKFSSPPKVEARHILLRSREEAEKVMERLRNGEEFTQLAKEFSIDLPMALEGGSMGTIEKGRTLPALEKVLFTLNEREVSNIVKTRYGYHILTVDKIIPASFGSYEEVKNDIKKIVLRQNEAKAFDEMATKLEKDADIRIFENRLTGDLH